MVGVVPVSLAAWREGPDSARGGPSMTRPRTGPTVGTARGACFVRHCRGWSRSLGRAVQSEAGRLMGVTGGAVARAGLRNPGQRPRWVACGLFLVPILWVGNLSHCMISSGLRLRAVHLAPLHLSAVARDAACLSRMKTDT